MNGLFPEDSAERKTYPVFSGFFQYFPAAIAAIAHHSYIGNEKHNPGQPLHWDRAKSDDEADAQLRHLMEGDMIGMGWRAMALVQKHCEANGAPIAPGARNATVANSATNVLDSTTAPKFPAGVIDHKTAGELLASRQHDAAEGVEVECLGSVCEAGQ